MSYARFGDNSDVYVFTSRSGLECCACIFQKREWVDDPDRPLFGGYLKPVGRIVRTTFKSNTAMINHLLRHRKAGHEVPEYALDRLRDPQDALDNQRLWKKWKETPE